MHETWLPVPIEGFSENYEVSSIGRVRRLTRSGRGRPAGYILSPRVGHHGYRRYTLCRTDGRPKGFFAHRLVLLAFVGPQPSPAHQAAHWDRDTSNNDYRNLR